MAARPRASRPGVLNVSAVCPPGPPHPLRRTRVRKGRRTVAAMTTKTAFTEQEWDLVLSGPPSAGTMVISAHGGGMMRETFEMAKVYAEARKQHGESELLDEIGATKPERDHTHYHSMDELRSHTLERLRETVALLESKATEQEAEDYKRF